MTIRERALALGIDPDDPKYHTDEQPPLRDPSQWCSWCGRHHVDLPRLRCDVQQAEAPEGAIACRRCQEPTLDVKGARCDTCRQREEAEEAKALRRRYPASRTLRQDDGCGCVERVHPVERDIYPDRFRGA